MSKNPYNIILIGIDTLRADHLGCYGYNRLTSSAIDDFAKDSMLFKKCFSQAPNTAPSFMSIMTSRYPTYHGILSIVTSENGGRGYVLNKSIPTMAEILKQNGYFTAAFTDGAQLDPMFGFANGFDFYSTNETPAGISKRGKGSIPEKEIFYFLEQNKNTDFFLFLHTYTVHNPWQAPWPYLDLFSGDYSGQHKITESYPPKMKWLQDRRQGAYAVFINSLRNNIHETKNLDYYQAIYDGAIKYVDDFFSRLLQNLSNLKLAKNTIIIFVADHGQEFLEHNVLGHKQLYNELLHVPLIMHIPDYHKAGIVGQLVRSIDILPTILEATKIKIQLPIHGTSLLSSSEKDLNLPAIAETERQGFSIQNNKYKLINHVNKLFLDELYDIENDPHETVNIAVDNLDIVESMRWDFDNELHKYPNLRPRKKTIYLAPELIQTKTDPSKYNKE